MDGFDNHYFQTQSQYVYSYAPPCASEKEISKQLLCSSTGSIFQSSPEIHYGSSSPIARHLHYGSSSSSFLEERKEEKVQILKKVGVPTKVKRLLTCRVTKRCCTMFCQVSIWTGRKKIKQSKKLQKPADQ